MITAIITGDIINSRKAESTEWLPALKGALNQYGSTPKAWEIYRGDSFQLEVSAEKALYAALYLKACMRQYKNLDARIGIGLGEKTHSASRITESNGSAFRHSGECFDSLKKNTLAIKSEWPELDQEVNGYLSLALLTIERWASNASTIIKTAMENPQLTQTELAKKLGKSQSTISESLTRAGYDEIMQMEKQYRNLISHR
ncbi:SatD family protein [Marinoscillum sp.]|uniref:SatD family protein n=1 Tax=Marinoscillum sp. TaxID=2024838 RepID=UPI003BA9F7C3